MSLEKKTVSSEVAHSESSKAREIKERTFAHVRDAEAYLGWKESVPEAVRKIVEAKLLENAEGTSPEETGLPTVDAFLAEFGKQIQGSGESNASPEIKRLLGPLSTIKTSKGTVNFFETVTSATTSWELRRKLYDTQVAPILEWAVAHDLSDLHKKSKNVSNGELAEVNKGESRDNDSDIPPSGDNVSSSLESEQGKKEGTPTALFSVAPFYGGKYRQSTFNRFNPDTGKWQRSEHAELAISPEQVDLLSKRLLTGKVRGGEALALPIPYDFVPDVESLVMHPPDIPAKIIKESDGRFLLHVSEGEVFNYSISISKKESISSDEAFLESEIAGEVPASLQKLITEHKNLPPLKRARTLARAVRDHLTYVTGKPELWREYVASGFWNPVWEKREADCFVANTLASKVLKEAGLDVRFVSGYMVKEKDEQGRAVLHAGNGHAWLEVWDEASGRSVPLDATPAGDPNVDQESQEQELSDEADEGEPDDELASEEEVREKIEALRGKEGGVRRGRKSPEHNRAESQFAKQAECSEAQAREFLNALERVRQISNKEGEKVSETLVREWQKIVQSRKVESTRYHGPVRRSEGDGLDDPVLASIDVASGERDPGGFEREVREQKQENDFGGIDLYFSFDLSGSMAEPDPASGRAKRDVQRDVALLFIDSLMQAAAAHRRDGANADILPLKLAVVLSSGAASVELPLTDKWTPKEQWKLYSAVNRLASGGTPTAEALAKIIQEVTKEKEELTKKRIPKQKQPIHYVLELGDGVPNDEATAETRRDELAKDGAFVRAYIIGTKSPSKYAAEPLESFSELPAILSRDIVEQFRKLYPHKIKGA